ncbi:MAG: hypothetical protein NC335_00405 [Bacteroides sp.]|nr:hypothetical protein [Bacteroides sp.]
MPYDINSIRRTTEEGIQDLADKIFAGIVNEEEAINALFNGLRSKLEKELEKRRAEEVLWLDVFNSHDLKKLSDYVETYDNEAPEYVGQFVHEAKLTIFNLEEDTDWQHACNINSIESYKSYLDKYDQPSSMFRGKYIESAKQKIQELLPPPPLDPRIVDEEVWNTAIKVNTIDGYRQYLSHYKLHANEAELAIRHLIDENAWKEAKGAGSVAAFKKYLSICKVNEYPGYTWAHINAAKSQIENLEKVEEAQREEEEYWDWRLESDKNTFQRFVDKYEPMSADNLLEAKKKIKEQTSPIKWKKWLLIVLALALRCFLWIQDLMPR